MSTVRTALAARPALYRRIRRLRRIQRYVMTKPHEVEFQYFHRLAKTKGLMVDIGANEGQAAVSFGSLCRQWQIVSFEPNPSLLSELAFTRTILGRRYRYHHVGIADSPGELALGAADQRSSRHRGGELPPSR